MAAKTTITGEQIRQARLDSGVGDGVGDSVSDDNNRRLAEALTRLINKRWKANGTSVDDRNFIERSLVRGGPGDGIHLGITLSTNDPTADAEYRRRVATQLADFLNKNDFEPEAR
jgi:hypothetical protein